MGILSVFDAVKSIRRSVLSLTILTSIVAASLVNAQEQVIKENIEQLPYCGNEHSRSISRRLLYVSTLDGKVTALDLSEDGKVHWTVPTGPGSLISSSIHRLELTNNGQLVRMIPSLGGGIYKFDGENIDPIPITAEKLLSSSFKFSDDLVISGGKETRSYGVSARTGQVLYECSMEGCLNNTKSIAEKENEYSNYVLDEHDSLLDDVVVIRRQTQTIRAIEPRTGVERWNFSVGQHELEVMQSSECHDKPISKADVLLLDLDIKMIVPDGIICAFSKSNPNQMLWKHQFDHPIVSAWKTDSTDKLRNIDLFGSAQWIWNPNKENMAQEGLVSPSIYLGMYQKQLYIQESKKLHKLLSEKIHNPYTDLIEIENLNYPTIPFKPLAATTTAIPLITNENDLTVHDSTAVEEIKNTEVTAISILYASEYVNGNGFYFYTKDDIAQTSTALCNSNESSSASANELKPTNDDDFPFEFTDNDTPVKIIIVSLWFWWKEIIVISLTTALILNLILSPKFSREREVVVIERHIAVPTAMEATEESTMSNSRSTQRSLSESNSQNSANFISRFQSDFDLMQCLGKGGFGVVFEARNKLDDCAYAVKRIILPNKKEKRDRVMREVKTLANCEHHNIVRYFQAWIETPPPGWQEEEDQKWSNKDPLSTSIEIETPDGTTLPSFPGQNLNLKNINSNKEKCVQSWISNVNEKQFSSIGDCKTEDDSYIEFRAESNENSKNINERQDLYSNNIHSIDSECKHYNGNNNNDSFEIEFEHSKNTISTCNSNKDSSITNNNTNTNSIFSNDMISKNSISYKRGHKRPLSLDLSRQKHKALVPFNKQSPPPYTFSALPTPKIQNKVYLYIQMQLCRKQSLRDWLREHHIELRQSYIQNYFEQIVDAVDYVHQKGLIHRDLKPSNIFFSLDGQIRIGDFGLVTDMPETPTSSENSLENINVNDIKSNLSNKHTQQVGTHLYMSPEQIARRSYDYKVDIYSLGLIFFEMLVYFGTEMERILTLKNLRDGKFPNDFEKNFPEEHNLLQLMLSNEAEKRPHTHDIKERLMSMTSWINAKILNDDGWMFK